MKSVRDFIVDSKGCCFFCLSPPTPLQYGRILTSARSQTYSIQSLSRYLKMDLDKVFIDKEETPSHLLAQIKNSKLKVQLCEECSALYKQFSERYRHLEKVKMEVGSCLSRIQDKLFMANETANVERFRKIANLDSSCDSSLGGVLEILDILRAEAVGKASKKLSTFSPRVKLNKLELKDIRSKQSKSPTLKVGRSDGTGSISNLSTEDFEMDIGEVKRELPWPNSEIMSESEFYNNSYCSDAEPNDLEGTEASEIKIVIPKMDNGGIYRTNNNSTNVGKISSKKFNRTLSTYKPLVNNATGILKCKICSMEFTTYGGFRLHHNSVHLKLRYKCVRCNKLFTQQTNLRTHQRTTSCGGAESRKKFNCHLCEKVYPRKDHLKDHVERVHHKLQKCDCDICGKKFNIRHTLNYHRRRVHGKMERQKSKIMSESESDNSNGNSEDDGMEGEQAKTTKVKMCQDKISSSNSKTLNEIRPGAKTDKVKCKLCSEEFDTYMAYRLHHKSVHLKLRYKCVRCNKLFTQKSNLGTHQRTSRCGTMGSSKNFNCQLCEKAYGRKDHLKDHVERVHDKSQKCACDICGKKFNIRCTLSQHVRKVHGEKR